MIKYTYTRLEKSGIKISFVDSHGNEEIQYLSIEQSLKLVKSLKYYTELYQARQDIDEIVNLHNETESVQPYFFERDYTYLNSTFKEQKTHEAKTKYYNLKYK